MVNSVSSVNAAKQTSNVAKQAEVKKLVAYINGESLKQLPDTFESTTVSGVKSAGVFSGIPFINFLKNRRIAGKIVEYSEPIKEMSSKLIEGDKATVKAFKEIFQKGGKLTDKLANYKNVVDANAEVYRDITKAAKLASKTAKIEGKIAKYSKETGIKLLDKFHEFKLGKLTTKVDKVKNLAEEAAKKALSKTTEETAIKVAGEGAKTVSKLGKAGKLLKKSGAGFMLAFSGVMETITEVVPTFKELGKEKGMKQVGKSAVKVIGDTAGFVAGQAVGKLAGGIVGAKVGAALGSFVPGIGNVVGAAVGLIGGLLGSFIAGKITKKITGPTEREKAKEEQTKQAVNDISKDKESLDALKQAAAAKIQQEAETTGTLSEDSYIALDSLSKLEGKNPFAAQA